MKYETRIVRGKGLAWATVITIGLTFILYVFFNYIAGIIALKFEYSNLRTEGQLLIPAQDAHALAMVEEKLKNGDCSFDSKDCGEWMPLQNLDFTKIKGNSLQTVFMVSFAELSSPAERAMQKKPFEHLTRQLGYTPDVTPLVLKFADSYAELTAWVNGKKAGTTSRNMSLAEKPLYFTNTEAIPIPASLISQGTSRIVVKISRFSDISLPAVFRINSFSLTGISEYMLMESINLMILVGCIITQFILLLYHLAIWFGRRSDVNNLAFVIYVTTVVSQEFFFYNLSAYFGVSVEFSWRMRMIFVHGTPIAFVACAWAIGIPISHLWAHVHDRMRGIKETSFLKLSTPAKIGTFLLEGISFFVFPSIALANIFLPLSLASTIAYKFSVPMSVITSFGFFFVTCLWFFRTSKIRNTLPVLPFALAICVSQGGTFSSMLSALGVNQFSGLAVGYANLLFTALFAVTLASNFSALHLQLEKLRDRLEQLLVGTREISSTHEAIPAVAKAAQHFLQQISFGKSAQVSISFVEGEERHWRTFHVIKEGKTLTEEEPLPLTEQDIQSCEKFLLQPGSTLTPNQEVIIPLRTGETDLGLLHLKPYSFPEILSDDEHFMNTFALSLSISLENIRFLQESKERVRMEAELGAAKAIQEALLPGEWKIPTMNIASHYQAASQTGGDWYGYHLFPDGRHADVFIGDVTGHGIPSALLTGVIYGSVYSMEMSAIHHGILDTSHEERLCRFGHNLHTMVCNSGRNELMMTMALLSIDLETGNVIYLNAAHNPILWFQKENNTVKTMANRGNRLGFIGESTSFGVRQFQLMPGDSLFLYTDGLIENTANDEKTVFTEKRLRKIVEKTTDPETLKASILAEARDIWGEYPADDDVSFVILQWKGPISQCEGLLHKASN